MPSPQLAIRSILWIGLRPLLRTTLALRPPVADWIFSRARKNVVSGFIHRDFRGRENFQRVSLVGGEASSGGRHGRTIHKICG
jgi:hypothetical protein